MSRTSVAFGNFSPLSLTSLFSDRMTNNQVVDQKIRAGKTRTSMEANRTGLPFDSGVDCSPRFALH